eukprot:scaffold2016_cov131-Isochrysis_galbana.AAC.3
MPPYVAPTHRTPRPSRGYPAVSSRVNHRLGSSGRVYPLRPVKLRRGRCTACSRSSSATSSTAASRATTRTCCAKPQRARLWTCALACSSTTTTSRSATPWATLQASTRSGASTTPSSTCRRVDRVRAPCTCAAPDDVQTTGSIPRRRSVRIDVMAARDRAIMLKSIEDGFDVM